MSKRTTHPRLRRGYEHCIIRSGDRRWEEKEDILGENGVDAVEVGRLLVGDEELAAVFPRSSASKRNHSTFVEFQRINDLVLKVFAVDRFTPLARSRWVAALDDKVFDVAVKNGIVVVARGAEGQKVLHWKERSDHRRAIQGTDE